MMSGKSDVAADAKRGSSDHSLESAIGITVRQLRQQLNLTVGKLASQAGVSVAMLSKVENGQISPSLSTLDKLAEGLNVPISRLFSELDERRDRSFVAAGEGVVIDRRGTKMGHEYRLLGATLAGEIAVEPYLITLDEAATPDTTFRHDGVEFLFMLSGQIDYRHGDAVYTLAPGDAFLFDSAASHGPERMDELPATYLSIIVHSRR